MDSSVVFRGMAVVAADPRTAKTLGEAALNADGTYNGAKALSWLSECLTPGRGLSQEEVQAIFEEVKVKRSGT
jgi:hypothetical protein